MMGKSKEIQNVWETMRNSGKELCYHRILGELGHKYVTDKRKNDILKKIHALQQRKNNGIIKTGKGVCRTQKDKIHSKYKAVEGSGDYYKKKKTSKNDNKRNYERHKVKTTNELFKILEKDFVNKIFCLHTLMKHIYGNKQPILPKTTYKSGLRKKVSSLIDEDKVKKIGSRICDFNNRNHYHFKLINNKSVSKEVEQDMSEKTELSDDEKFEMNKEILGSNLSKNAKKKLIKIIYEE